jgi:two-component system, LytTR family, response regulator
MRLLIVDDERPARERLRRMLANQRGVAAIDEAADGFEALAMIEAQRPDALFLDVQMPELSGLELAASLPAPAPPIVFVTAFDEYAVPAFDANAIDYLLKPFDEARLQRALQRLRERLGGATAPPLPDLCEAHTLRKLLVPARDGTRVVPIEAIEWIETADNYVVLHVGAGEHLLRQTMSALLAQLGTRFVRCHRRAAVQVDWIERVVPLEKGDCELLLRGGARVPCSRQHREAVLERL